MRESPRSGLAALFSLSRPPRGGSLGGALAEREADTPWGSFDRSC